MQSLKFVYVTAAANLNINKYQLKIISSLNVLSIMLFVILNTGDCLPLILSFSLDNWDCFLSCAVLIELVRLVWIGIPKNISYNCLCNLICLCSLLILVISKLFCFMDVCHFMYQVWFLKILAN